MTIGAERRAAPAGARQVGQYRPSDDLQDVFTPRRSVGVLFGSGPSGHTERAHQNGARAVALPARPGARGAARAEEAAAHPSGPARAVHQAEGRASRGSRRGFWMSRVCTGIASEAPRPRKRRPHAPFDWARRQTRICAEARRHSGSGGFEVVSANTVPHAGGHGWRTGCIGGLLRTFSGFGGT